MAQTKNPTKYDQAVARSRGESIAIDVNDTGSALELLARQGVAEGVTAVTPEVIAELMRQAQSGETEVATQLLTLEEGQMLKGRLLSSGESKIEDIRSKEMKPVKTWQLALSSGARVSILGSAQLDRMLAEFIGRNVTIVRGATGSTRKGTQLTQYFVMADKAAATSPRSFTPDAAHEDLIGSGAAS